MGLLCDFGRDHEKLSLQGWQKPHGATTHVKGEWLAFYKVPLFYAVNNQLSPCEGEKKGMSLEQAYS